MFEYIRGYIAAIENDEWIVESGPFGFRIKVTPFVSHVNLGEEKQLYIRFYFREDGDFFYYGFEDPKERDTFDILCAIKGVGHKTAFKILSRIYWKELADLILTENVDYLSSRTNLAPKTIKRLLLELKPRFGKSDLILSTSLSTSQTWKEVKTALSSLGYTPTEIENVLNNLWSENQDLFNDTESLLKMALSKMGGQK